MFRFVGAVYFWSRASQKKKQKLFLSTMTILPIFQRNIFINILQKVIRIHTESFSSPLREEETSLSLLDRRVTVSSPPRSDGEECRMISNVKPRKLQWFYTRQSNSSIWIKIFSG